MAVEAGRLSAYYLTKGEAYRIRGDSSRARAYYDSAAVDLERRLQSGLSAAIEPEARAALGIAYAWLGRKHDAIREAKRAMASGLSKASAAVAADVLVLAADVQVIVGDYEGALSTLEAGWARPTVPEYYWWKLSADPLYAPLKDNPRFQKLAAFRPKSSTAADDSSGT